MTEWFHRRPGCCVDQGIDDPTMLLLGGDVPDWVRVPEDTGCGGCFRCVDVVAGPCPLPGHGEACRHYVLDGCDVRCAECEVNQTFVWYRTPGEA